MTTLPDALIAEVMHRSPTEFSVWARELLKDASPLVKIGMEQALQEGVKPAGLFGGNLEVDEAVIKMHGTAVADLHFQMKLKALALNFNRCCVRGLVKPFVWAPLPWRRGTGPFRKTVGTSSRAELRLAQYDDEGKEIFDPFTNLESKWLATLQMPLPFNIVFDECKVISKDHTLGYGIMFLLYRNEKYEAPQ